MASSDANGVLPPPTQLEAARNSLVRKLPANGSGLDWVKTHLQNDIVPGLNQNGGQNYYGFVTGGATEAARYADNVVTAHDQNVQVHLPNETVATDVEAAALEMICNLLDPVPQQGSVNPRATKTWSHRTFTTGATASNVLGLACGREYVVQAAARRLGKSVSTGDMGISSAMRAAEVDTTQILTTVAHSSLRKAASIVGLGRSNVLDVGRNDAPHLIDIDKLTSAMRQPRTASLVAVSCAEVNTGLFAANGDLMRQIRSACDEYNGWLHVDAAFGLLATVLPSRAEYHTIKAGVEELHLADSIAGDAHKLLNVPYDCGIFLSRYLEIATEVFQNPNAAYLNSASQGTSWGSNTTIPSPLNIGIENSRRFRALPVYATLVAYGRQWYSDMLERQVQLSRNIARFIAETPGLELLPAFPGLTLEKRLETIYMIVIFRASNEELNANLTKRINATRRIYVSGTQWDGRPATRFAVANWEVDVSRDFDLVRQILLDTMQS